MSCGKILTSGMGYNGRCGGLWMGKVLKCDRCKRKEKQDELLELKLENEKLKNKLLKLTPTTRGNGGRV